MKKRKYVCALLRNITVYDVQWELVLVGKNRRLRKRRT